jgi:site-specific DNA-methyltransferase (adenine-specific)
MFEVEVHCGDARELSWIPDESVHLVVTSPPYNVGKSYKSYSDDIGMTDYLAMLKDAFRQCERKLVPGGRICVNVPHGTGRKPYAPIGARITLLLESLFKLHGTIVWHKTNPVFGTAWGSWCSPQSPALRDCCELIIVASKPGKFVHENIGADDHWLTPPIFLKLTQDYWGFPSTTPSQSSHPAAFPVELAERCITLYAYRGSTILDPFAGSGTVAQAALNLDMKAIVNDIDPYYCAVMREKFCQQANFTDLFTQVAANDRT